MRWSPLPLLFLLWPVGCGSRLFVNQPAPAAPPPPPLLETARTRASFDFPSCPREQVTLRSDDATSTVDVQACGKRVLYSCPERVHENHRRVYPEPVRTYRLCEPVFNPEQASR